MDTNHAAPRPFTPADIDPLLLRLERWLTVAEAADVSLATLFRLNNRGITRTGN